MAIIAVIIAHVLFLLGWITTVIVLSRQVNAHQRALMLWRDRAFRLRNRLYRLGENYSFEEGQLR